MGISAQARLALGWLLLTGITLFAWWMGSSHGPGPLRPDPAVAAGAIAITVVKVRVIIMEFMDARHAPRRLRYLTDSFLALFVIAMLATYRFA
ncbi:MAG: cytochrome C oxidase subunit IV family protein [Novosphingobium sp.]|jgi:hypothetical protein|nr:cytochrome C oxidase subunit IV family protein [Novosphingobium sp.]